MVLSPDAIVAFLSYLLYIVQFLGVAMGVGAETVMLVSYVVAARDGVIEKAEERMALAVRRVLNWGLVTIIVSGLIITALHFASGEQLTTVYTAAYLFKWALIIFVLVFNSVLRHTIPLTALEGLAAGSWYALFLDHILALDVSWLLLVQWFAVWMIGFNLVWWAVVFLLKGSAATSNSPLTSAKLVSTSSANITTSYKPPPPPRPAPAPRPKPIVQAPPPAPPPPPPRPTPRPAPPINLPIQKPTTQSPASAPILKLTPVLEKIDRPNTAPTTDESGLPTIRVMPKTPEDVVDNNGANFVSAN